MQYQILRMDALGCPPLTKGGRPIKFDDPTVAAAAAKQYSKDMGEKLCVKPIVDEKWRKREEARFANGEYRHLPWALQRQTWWNSDQAYAIWKDQYPHASLEKPGWIAYTKSPEDGTKDKQSLLRPGSYLSQYFEKILDDFGVSDKALITQFMQMYGPIEVKFAETSADIVKVYDSGPQTCHNKGKYWPKDIHPASVYAAGDLQVAYIGDKDRKVSARAVVWPAKKLHSRMYGDVARLTQGLQRLGYKWGPPIGAKVKRIKLHDVNFDDGDVPTGCFLVPYIDKKNQQGGGHLAVKDMGDHLVITMDNEPGTHHAGLPDGYSGNYVPREDEYPTFTCQRCEEERREVLSVYINGGEDPTTESWCRDCVDEYSQHCYWSGHNFSDNVEMTKVDGQWWQAYYAEMYAVTCEGSGKLCHERNVKWVFYPDGTKKRLSNAYIEKLGGVFASSLTQRFHFRSELAHVYARYGERNYCAKSELKVHTFQCDGCDTYWTLPYRNQVFGEDRLFCPDCFATINKAGNKPIPVSPSRKIFEEQRKQLALRLEAAE